MYTSMYVYTMSTSMNVYTMSMSTSMNSTWRKVRPRYCFSAKARWPKVAAGRLVSVATT